MEFIDSHAHLTDPAFDADRTELISQRILQAHVVKSVEIGCAPNEWEGTLALAEKFPAIVVPVIGVHPEYAPQFLPNQVPVFQQFLTKPQVAAVGEIGLDYTCLEIASQKDQTTLFEQMITLADRAHKPLVLHVRRNDETYGVYDDTFSILRQTWKQNTTRPFSGVLHCFCARYEEAKKALDMGLLLGINGCFTYKKNEYIREAIRKVGADKIILETDCPYLSPQGKRGTRNDPSNIPLIAQYVADYLNIPLEDLAQKTTQQTKLLYGLN